jgi:hypothetical protein
MNDLPFLGKIKMPLFMWVMDWIALLFAGAVSIVWPFLFFEPPYSPHLWAGIILWLIPLAGLVGMTKDFIGHIKITKLEIQEDGVHKPTKTGDILLKWEDVTRCEPQYGIYGIVSLTLFFGRSERIRIPGCVKDIKDIENYCLQKLEQIGTFEDGRKVPRVIFSIPLPFGRKR